MKKMFILPIALLFSITGVYASVEDNSIIEELSKENTKENIFWNIRISKIWIL